MAFQPVRAAKYLTAFLAVAHSGSFTKAAKALHLSQPAVSVAVHNLEQIVGVRLFDRSTRRVALTAYGAHFVPVAERLFADFTSALGEVSGSLDRDPNQLRIAAVESVATQVLPAAVAAFLAARPAAQITLHDSSSQRVWRHVKWDTVDLGFANETDSEPELEFSVLFKDRLGVFARADSAIVARREAVDWADLGGYEFVRILGESPARILDAMHGLPQNLRKPTHGLSHSKLVWALLAESERRVTVVPAMLAKACPLGALTFLPLKNPTMWRSVYAVTAKGRTLSPQALDMLERMRAVVARLAAHNRSLRAA